LLAGLQSRSDVLAGLRPEAPTVAHVTMVAVRSGSLKSLTLALLTAWVILGPVGMAFDSCAAMMALCDGGPCGVVSAVTDAAPSLAPPTSLMIAVTPRSEWFTPLPQSALEPPPKFVRLP
jgi:hypothetical protein